MAAPPAEAVADAVTAGFQSARGSQWREAAFKYGLIAAMAVALITLGVLLVDIFADGIGQFSLNFLTEVPSRISPADSGIGAAIVGTLWLMGICAAFIIPVGIASAIYLEEYANRDRWHNRLIETNIQNLAAVPSIVYGILGLAFLVRGPLGLGNVLLAGGLTLALLVLPVVIVAAREAIRAVPPSIREGSMALGATRWQTISKQVVPAAVPGIATGTILALSRAIGEAAPLLLLGGLVFVKFDPNGLLSGFTTMPIQIFDWASRSQAAFQQVAAAASILLLFLVIGLNGLAIIIRNRYTTPR